MLTTLKFLTYLSSFSNNVFHQNSFSFLSTCVCVHSLTAAYDNIGRFRRQRLVLAYYSSFTSFCVCVCSSFLTTSCVVTKTISVALLLYPVLGLALSESEQWRSFACESSVYKSINNSFLKVFNETYFLPADLTTFRDPLQILAYDDYTTILAISS